jgi:hypothetical protein
VNALNVIVPYKWEGMWVFDDARVGLLPESFGSGADDMIDVLVADIPKADTGFRQVSPGRLAPPDHGSPFPLAL